MFADEGLHGGIDLDGVQVKYLFIMIGVVKGYLELLEKG